MSRDCGLGWQIADLARSEQRRRGLSVRQAAAEAGLPPSTFQRVASGDRIPNLATVEAILRFVGIDLNKLLSQ